MSWPTDLSKLGLTHQETDQITKFMGQCNAIGPIKIKHHDGLPRSLYVTTTGKVIVLLKGDVIAQGTSTSVKLAYGYGFGLLAEKKIIDHTTEIKIDQFRSMQWDDFFISSVFPHIQGPGVVPYVTRRKEIAQSFIYEEFFDTPLQNHLQTQLSTSRKISMVGQFLEGLARIHSVSVIILGQNFPVNHGDLKPQNILIDSETDRLGITDFGSSCWVKNYVSTSRYLSPLGIQMQKEQGLTEEEICEDLKKFGQKRDVWSAAIVISAIVLNGLNEHFMPPLNFLTSRVKTLKNDPTLLDFSTISQAEISAEFNRLIMQTSNVQEKNLLKLCYKLFVISDEQRCTSQQALDAYNAYFKR